MSRHHLRNKGSPEHRQSAKGILLGLEQKNRSRALSARVEELKTKLAARTLQNIKSQRWNGLNADDAYGRTISMSPSKFLQNASGDGGNKVQRSLSDAHSNPGHSGIIFTKTQKDYDAPREEGKPTPLLDQMKTDTNVNVRGDELGGVEYYKRKIRRGDAIQPPDFSISSRGKSISGHEGRHRARAFKEEGVKKIPVGLVAYSGGRADELGVGLRNRTRTKLQGIKPQSESGSGERDTRNPIMGRKAKIEYLQQKLAGFGLPPQRVIDAFRNGTPAETSKFKTDGKKLLFNGHEVARHKPGGIEVSYQGFNTSMTSATIRALGVDTRRTRGVTTINGKGVDPETKDFHFVPTEKLSEGTFRVNPSAGTVTPRQVIDKQELFRKRVRKELTGDATKIPLDTTAIQPQDQREINSITGVTSKIPRETKGVDTHHLLPKEHFPGLGTNANNGVGLSKKNHASLHGLNKKLFSGAKLAELKLKLRVAELKAFTNSSSFVGNMRYDSDEQTITGILSGKHYQWCDVPERKFDSFMGAGSAGAYFNRSLKGQHDCSSGGILSSLKSRISKMKALNNEIHIDDGMAQIAQNLSADGIVDNFVNSKTDVQGVSGVYDPVQNKVLDATRPVDAIRLQKFFNSEHLGFNSVTDTRAGPNVDIELVRTQLRDIENNGGTPALGFDGGSLEALDISFETSDEGHLGRLLDHQNSTGVLDSELNFRILKNPKYTQ